MNTKLVKASFFHFFIFFIINGLNLYSTDEHFERECLNEVSVVSSSYDFLEQMNPPYFQIKANEKCSKLWWQIASDSEFSIPCFDQVQDFNEFVNLPYGCETLLDVRENYFFRCKVKSGDIWSEWSSFYPFQVDKEEVFQSHILFENFASSKFLPGLIDLKLLHGELGNATSRKMFFDDDDDYVSCRKYVKSSYVSDEVWNAVYPHLLPADCPLREKLDYIFESTRVIEDEDTMAAAGFTLTKDQGLHVVAAKHKLLKGFVVKMYPDFKSTEEEWKKWIQRIEGAGLIRAAIKKLGYDKEFKVAKKWIYPLPENPSPPNKPGYQRKNFILIVEDLKLENPSMNRKKYHNDMTPRLLDQIYNITEMLGLADSLRISNLSWTKHGKLAFVDTEAYNRWPVKFHPLMEYLSRPNKKYWSRLTKKARKEDQGT